MSGDPAPPRALLVTVALLLVPLTVAAADVQRVLGPLAAEPSPRAGPSGAPPAQAEPVHLGPAAPPGILLELPFPDQPAAAQGTEPGPARVPDEPLQSPTLSTLLAGHGLRLLNRLAAVDLDLDGRPEIVRFNLAVGGGVTAQRLDGETLWSFGHSQIVNALGPLSPHGDPWRQDVGAWMDLVPGRLPAWITDANGDGTPEISVALRHADIADNISALLVLLDGRTGEPLHRWVYPLDSTRERYRAHLITPGPDPRFVYVHERPDDGILTVHAFRLSDGSEDTLGLVGESAVRFLDLSPHEAGATADLVLGTDRPGGLAVYRLPLPHLSSSADPYRVGGPIHSVHYDAPADRLLVTRAASTPPPLSGPGFLLESHDLASGRLQYAGPVLGGELKGGSAFADLDADGLADAAIVTDGNRVHILEGATGEERWTAETLLDHIGPIALGGGDAGPVVAYAELQGDGANDRGASTVVVRDAADGSLQWSNAYHKWHRTAALLDLGPSHGPRLVTAGWDQLVHAFSLADGTEALRLMVPSDVTGLVVDDWTGDGVLDAVTAGGDRHVLARDGATGRARWVVDTGERVQGLLPADLDSDGRRDVIVVGAFPGALTALDGHDGRVLWRHQAYRSTDNSSWTASAADFDGDGVLDAAYASQYFVAGAAPRGVVVGVLRGVDGTALLELPLPLGALGVSIHDLAIGDLDADGTLDVVVSVRNTIPLDTTIPTLFAVSGATGLPLWQTRLALNLHSILVLDTADGPLVVGATPLVPTTSRTHGVLDVPTGDPALLYVDGATGRYRFGVSLAERFHNHPIALKPYHAGDATWVAAYSLVSPASAPFSLRGEDGAEHAATPPVELNGVFDFEFVDWTGDGWDDVVVPRESVWVADGKTLAEEGSFRPLGRLDGLYGSRLLRDDLDLDGVAEVLLVASRGIFPVGLDSAWIHLDLAHAYSYAVLGPPAPTPAEPAIEGTDGNALPAPSAMAAALALGGLTWSQRGGRRR